MSGTLAHPADPRHHRTRCRAGDGRRRVAGLLGDGILVEAVAVLVAAVLAATEQ